MKKKRGVEQIVDDFFVPYVMEFLKVMMMKQGKFPKENRL